MNLTFSPSWRQLRAFRAVFQLQKLSAAAEQLSVTQSAISVLLRQLEEGLGVRLFDRTTRSLRPTPAALDVIGVVERILRDVDSLGAGLRDLGALKRGRVVLAVTPTLGEIILPAVLQKFSEIHPAIRVDVDDCAPEQFVSRVLTERVDFGIGTPERAAADVDLLTLVTDTLSLVCRDDHPLARRKRLRWKDLHGIPVVTVRPGYGIRQMIDGAALRAGVELDVVGEVAFLTTALWMAEIGTAAAIMPSAYAVATRHPALVVRKLQEPCVTRDISVVSKRGRSMSVAAQALVDLLLQDLKLQTL